MKFSIFVLAALVLAGCRDRDTFKQSRYSNPILETTNSAAGADRNARVDTIQPRPATEQPVQSATGATNQTTQTP